MPKPSLSRRDILKGFGAAAALPYLPSGITSASAATGSHEFPTRLIIFGANQGLLPEDLIVPGTNAYDFSLGPILEPLQDLQDKILFLTNIHDQSNVLDGSYNGHTRCLYHTLTAEKMERSIIDGVLEVTGAGGPSIDQVVAQRWAGQTPFSSLDFASPGTNANGKGSGYFWKKSGVRVLSEESPNVMFDRIFGTMVADPDLRGRIYRRRTTVIDAIHANVKSLRPNLSRADILHLDAHIAALEALERNLAALQNIECNVTINDTPDLGSKQAFDYKPRQIKAQMDMMVNALACDMTRVATFAYQDDDWGGFPYIDGVNVPGDTFHQLVHDGPSTPENQDQLRRVFSWQIEQLNYLLTALDSVPEGDNGETLLDHSLVVYANVFGTGASHSDDQKCYLLAGGANGMLATGRHEDCAGRSHSDLLTAVLNILGFSDQTFGDPDFCTGPMAEVL